MMPLTQAPSRQWRLSELLAGFASVPQDKEALIGQLSLDSRQVEPGGLFLACRGWSNG